MFCLAGLKVSLITHGLGVIAALALSDVLLSLRPFVRLCEPLVLTRRRFRMRQRLRTASSVRGVLVVLPPLLVRHYMTVVARFDRLPVAMPYAPT